MTSTSHQQPLKPVSAIAPASAPDDRPSSEDVRALGANARRERSLQGERDVIALVRDARAGDPAAWTRLIQRYDHMLHHVARSYRLAPDEVDDVVQATRLNLFESIEQIRDPMALGGWLATVTRRHALKRIKMHAREQLTDDPRLGDRAADDGPDMILLARERRAILTEAIARLPDRQRELVTVLLTQPALGYGEIAELISMPTGSIGPIRGRSLARLARDANLRALREATVTALPRRPSPGLTHDAGSAAGSACHAARGRGSISAPAGAGTCR